MLTRFISTLVFSGMCLNMFAQSTPRKSYFVDQPELQITLPEVLNEISGLSHSNTPGALFCVQDESGVVFKIDGKTGVVLQEIPFGKPGDYEGIELVNTDSLWILKSSGTLFLVDLKQPNGTVTRVNTFLSKEADVEGLGYHPSSHSLLLACKGPTPGLADTCWRAVYRFDLKQQELQKAPYLVIPESFEPSSIATHPLTGEIYILSATAKGILVFSGDGQQIVERIKLPKSLFPQAEGLSFTSEGKMYISSEAKKNQPPRLYLISTNK